MSDSITEYKDIAKHVAMQTAYLNKDDAVTFANLFLKSFNTERELYVDDLMNEGDFHKLLSLFDIRFKKEE